MKGNLMFLAADNGVYLSGGVILLIILAVLVLYLVFGRGRGPR